jgi:hypothetical protein
VNTEYLKNVILHFMSSSEPAEKKSLTPVICAVLRFTAEEQRSIMAAIDREVTNVVADATAEGAANLLRFNFSSLW